MLARQLSVGQLFCHLLLALNALILCLDERLFIMLFCVPSIC